MTTHNEHKDNRSPDQPLDDQVLFSAGKQNPFRVPDGFFDDQRTRIKNRIADLEAGHESPVPVKKILPGRVIPALLASAAIIVLLISIFRTQEPQQQDFIQGLTFESLLQENPDFVLYFDESELIEILLATETLYDPVLFETVPDLDSGIYDEDLINYLLESELEEESLYN